MLSTDTATTDQAFTTSELWASVAYLQSGLYGFVTKHTFTTGGKFSEGFDKISSFPCGIFFDSLVNRLHDRHTQS